MSREIGVELILDSQCILGEGPWWDYEKDVLYSTDGFDNKVFVYNPKTKQNKQYDVGQYIGCVIPYNGSDDLLVCLQDGIYKLDQTDGRLSLLSDTEREIGNNRFNDGKCDSSGRLWFGSMSMTANQPGEIFEVTGSFYKMDGSYKVTRMLGDVSISNGLAWNADDTVLYYIDSLTRAVSAFDFDIDKGLLSNRRTVVTIDKADGIPDGMTIDAEGMLWVAHFGGWQVSHWDPATGRKLGKIALPVSNVTSCCFGGKNLDELYITTANTGLDNEPLRRQQPLAGALFMAKPGVRGTRLSKFKKDCVS